MKRLLPLCLVCFLSLNIFGQILFEDHLVIENIPQPDGARISYTADLDGDGDMDVIGGFAEVIVWYENTNGLGIFSSPKLITSYVDNLSALDVADLDGDGDLDVYSASANDDKIAWYENEDGQGTFGEQQVITTFTDTPKSVHAGDIDGDGDMDIVSASAGDSKIAWYENEDGLGTFGDQQIITSEATGALFVNASDFDGDGDLDVLYAYGDNISWHENEDSQGTFGDIQYVDNYYDGIRSIFVVDIDGDSDKDIVYSTYDNTSKQPLYRLTWIANIGGLYTTFSSVSTLYTSDYEFKAIYAFDVDGDGDVDVLSDLDSDGVVWYKNLDGDGSFGDPIFLNIEDEVNSINAADLNGDGGTDILTTSDIENEIAWYKNVFGIGNFGNAQSLDVKLNGPNSSFAADLDGDGDMDVLSVSGNDNKIAWYKNEDGQGTFGDQNVITVNAEGASAVYAADLDGDGDMDVLSAAQSADKIAWYENEDGQGTFGGQHTITWAADGANSVHAADLDGDGDLDVLSASYVDDKIAWYENEDGLGAFGSQQIISTNANGANSVYTIDLDGDGDLDVLSASYSDDKIAWYENEDGLGNFGNQQIITTETNGANSVFGADLDNDGDMDVLAASVLDDKIAWYENEDGLGSFGDQQIISTNTDRANSVYATDLDGDGDQDVLSASENDDKIAWYENQDGQGTFGSQQIITINADGARNVHAADIDGDGDMDVLSASYFDDKIAWYKNIGLDTESPIAICQNVSITLDQSGVANLAAIDLDNGSSDNGINETFELSQTEFDCSNVGAHDIVMTIEDAAGNSDSCNAIVTVIDNSPPIVYSIPTVTINLAGESSISLTPDQVDNGSFDNCGIAAMHLSQNTFTEIGDYIVEFSVEDPSNNNITNTVSVTVINDYAPPIASCQDVNIQLAENGFFTISVSDVDNGSTDEFGIETIGISPYSFNCADLGVNETTLTVTDVVNNSSTCTATVTVVDNLDPTVKTSNRTRDLAGEASVSITVADINTGSFDNCEIASMSLDQDTFTEVGEYEVVLTVEDASGNTSSKSAMVTVINSVVGVEHLNTFEKNLIIHPIPTTDQITIKAPNNIAQIKIYNTQGQLLISQNTNNVSISNINLTDLATGLYFCEVKDNAGNVGVRKVIKK